MKNKKIYDFIFNNEIKIPTYQRIYTWKKEQINSFMDDLIFDMYKSREINLGVIYYDLIHDKGYAIIDGQQRITTFYLLSNAIIFLNSDNKSKQAKKILAFNQNRNLSTTIETLNSSYDDLYDFINNDVTKNNPDNILKNLNRYIKDKGFKNGDEVDEDGSVKSELVMGMKCILEYLSQPENEEAKNLLLKQNKDGDYTLFDSTFFPIENPYKDDPISLFERLNNRGVELNFVSLSKIKVHQYIISKSKLSDSAENIEASADNFLNAYNDVIYSPFSSLGKNMNADQKDAHIQKALIGYLELTNNVKIGSDKNKALEQLGEFLEERLGSIKDFTIYNSKKSKTLLKNIFEHFTYYLTVYIMYEKKWSKLLESSPKAYKYNYVINNSFIRKYSVVSTESPSEFRSISDYTRLKSIKIEKYNNLLVYLTSLNIMNNGNDVKEEEISELYNNLTRLSIIYWINHIGIERKYDLLLRDDLDLGDFLKITSKNISKYPSKTINAIYDLSKKLLEKYDTDDMNKKIKSFKDNVANEITKIEKVTNKKKVEKIVNIVNILEM